MPMKMNLPKSCASNRGVSDIPRISSPGGGLAQQANRLYMLTVRHKSLMNKWRSLEIRLKEVKGQLEGIEADIRATEVQYRKLKGNRSRKKGREEGSVEEKGNGRGVRSVPLEF